MVINRVGLAPKQEMQPSDYENGVGSKVAIKIPFAPDVFMRVGNDIPAVKMKTHPSVKALLLLANELIPEAKKPQTEAHGTVFNFFKGRK